MRFCLFIHFYQCCFFRFCSYTLKFERATTWWISWKRCSLFLPILRKLLSNVCACEAMLVAWPGIVTGPRSPHLSAYLHMLHNHVACKLRGCRSRVRVHMHVECTAWIGNVVSLRLCTSKIFSSCALQTFLIPLTHNLAKVPPSAVLAFSRSSPSPSLFALVDPSAQIAWTPRETEKLTSMFGFCAEHRQGSSPSVLSRGVLQQSGILVVWSHFRPSNVVLKSIDSTSHTVRQIDC